LQRPSTSTLFPYTTLFRSLERDLPGAHREEPHDAVDRRRLPGAVAADEADSLAVLDGERDTAQDLRRPAEGVDPLELEHHSRHQDRKSTRLNSSHVSISYA